ncbi:MAG: gamma-glutamyl-gamma-aminobutyrate hydrolase family protein [Anaerolineae bacterium]
MADKRSPLIGVTCMTIQAEGYSPRLGMSRSYVHVLLKAGAAPLLIPHMADTAVLRSAYERLDGLLLPGGGDIDPVHYGESRHEKCNEPSAERDGTELVLARWAIEDGKPLLGICRGIQVLNVALGGSLFQDIQAQIPGAERHDWYPNHARDRLSHTVSLSPATRLAHITGTSTLPVNSLHHQSVKDVAPGLVATGWSPDEIVEAVEAPDHPFAIAVQWHPEELAGSDDRAQRLFDALVEAGRQ